MEATDATAPEPLLGVVVPSPSVVELRAGRAVIIAVVYFLVQIVIGAVIGIGAVIYYARAQRGLPSITQEMLASVMLPAAAVGMIAGGLAVFALTARVLRRAEDGLRSIGWCRASSREIWLSIAGGVLVAALFLLVVTQIHPPAAGQKWGPLATAAASGGWQRGFWVLIVLLAAPIEEFVFRGVLWTGLRRSFGGVIAAGVVTVLFVAAHATEALGYWPAWLAIIVMSVGTLVQRARTGSLIPPLALHAAYNASLAVTVYLGAA